MLEAGCKFVSEMPERGYMLSFLGKAGTGKTMLARAILDHAKRYHGYFINENLCGITQRREIYFRTAKKIADMVYDRDREGLEDLAKAWLLVIDDLGTGFDKSGYALSEIENLIDRRLGKYTVITSNMDLSGVANNLDPRIASRLVRDNNIVVGCDTADYAMRNEK